MAHVLEKVYPHVPVWAQNFGISLYGLLYRRERLGGDFERRVAGFRERDRWDPERMRDYVDRELRQMLMHAFEQVPFYSQRWTVAGITRSDLEQMTAADLPKLPITRKADLRADSAAFVARDVARCEKLHRYFSSGSTGTPVTMFCTADGHRRFLAAREVRSFGWAGASIRQSRSMIGGRLVVPRNSARPPFHRYNRAERQVYFSATHIAPQHVRDYVAAFNQYRPALLTGYAQAHYLLARMMREQGLTLDYEPTAAVLSSEKLTTEMKQAIRQSLRTPAFEEYGSVENCGLATECEHGRLHAHPDFGVIEIVDDAGQPVPPGVEGRIICTGLLNDAQPLIRDEIGDRGIWSAERCPCGRDHLPVIQEVVGRLEDVLVCPDGREIVIFLWVFIDLPHVIEGQVIQEALDRFTVKVVVTTGYGQVDEQMIRQRFAQRVGPVQLTIEVVPEIPRTERGKFRAVISKLERR